MNKTSLQLSERLYRLAEVASQRLRRRGKSHRSSSQSAEPVFLIPHFNAAEFLSVTLHAVRRHHPQSRIIVADSTSAWEQYQGAKRACERFGAELRALPWGFRHTALLNYLLGQAQGTRAVFLDQDCVPLGSLSPLLHKLSDDILLIGPRDRMVVEHPRFCLKYPHWAGVAMRDYPDYIHASLMVVDTARVRTLFGSAPFTWSRDLGRQPLEKYYGLCQRLLATRPAAMIPLESRHSGYGLGMFYLYEGRPVAYHNWYSGRIHGKQGELDALDIDWLRAEMARFLEDYWNGTLQTDE